MNLYEALPSLREFEKRYRLVDDRRTFVQDGATDQGTCWPKTRFTFHYNGPAVSVGNPSAEYATAIAARNVHTRPNWFGPGSRADGLQYHFIVMSDRLIVARDPNRVLWNAANYTINREGMAFFFPIGEGQRPYGEMWRIALCAVECIGHDLGIQQPLSKIIGHQEACNGCTACPGLVMDNIRALRVELGRNPAYHLMNLSKTEAPKKERWSHELPGADGKPRRCGSGFYALYKGAGANAERYFGKALSEETDAVLDGTKGTVMHFENVSFGYFPGKKHVGVLTADEMRKLRWNI